MLLTAKVLIAKLNAVMTYGDGLAAPQALLDIQEILKQRRKSSASSSDLPTKQSVMESFPYQNSKRETFPSGDTGNQLHRFK